jgi:hypothetical protein
LTSVYAGFKTFRNLGYSFSSFPNSPDFHGNADYRSVRRRGCERDACACRRYQAKWGENLIVLLALSDSGHPAYEAKHAEAIATLGCPVFACTPGQFPSMMASALTGRDLLGWAAEQDALIRES